ncbi:MAG TPA: NFACT family protein [Candidatus Bilamarchaeum sp.]|nr:NFACT family protein [Candidatus Bilamarchaeum sp.]
MRKMNNLEYSFLADELARGLVGKHFGRMRKLGENTYRMKIGSFEVLCELGVRIHLTKYLTESDSSDKFSEKLGKELDNAKLLAVEQVNKDRILSFVFDKGTLVFEMFGNGNAVLVRGGATVCAHRYESWSDREIKAGAAYSSPRNVPSDKVEAGDRYIIVSLTKLPLGKEYALEALARLGIDEKTPGTSLSGNKLLSIEQEIAKIRSGAKPYGFFDGARMEDFALTMLSKHKALEAREFPSLSDAIDEYYSKLEAPNPKLEKLTERLAKQAERVALLEAEEKEYRARGDYIYEKYAEAERAIALAKAGKFEELGEAKIDKKEKSVEIEL